MTFKDHFSGHAADYRVFRPTYPPALFAFLADVAPGRTLCWDCGTGSGQAAVALADCFGRVFATDASADQVRQAEPHPGVEYAVATAERCPLPDGSADLVTVAQALHWFDFGPFYAEVQRVGRPGGLLAAWAYDFHSVGPDVDRLLDRLQSEYVGSYWPPERVWVRGGYRDIPFPFPAVPAPEFELTADWDLPRLSGYINTWSAIKRFVQANGFDPLDRLGGELAAAWGELSTVRTVRWKLPLRVGRIGGGA